MSELPSNSASQSEWINWCMARLSHHEEAAARDPLTNSVRRLAYELFAAHSNGDITNSVFASLIKGFSDQAVIERADAFADSHFGDDVGTSMIADFLSALKGKPFDEVRSLLERTRAGIVFTAHPTFAMSSALLNALADYISADSDEGRNAAKLRVSKLDHKPDLEISLADEHLASQQALARAKEAVRDVTKEILNWASKEYPDQWTSLTPRPLSLATWVGYDLDGRTDIHWSQSLRLRLEEKAHQLQIYSDQLKAIPLGQLDAKKDDIVVQLKRAADLTRKQAELFAQAGDEIDAVAIAANQLTGENSAKLTSLDKVLGELDTLLEEADGPSSKMALSVLKSEMTLYGLGASHIHLRINAAQVRSALRAEFDFDETRDFDNRTTLSIAAQKARNAAPRRVNIASVFLEQMTAHRQLMLCAQILKHIDADAPIRFLIAECEAPATIMGAIFLARRYGISHRLDISPLFETPEAIERGGRFLERLLDEDEFVEYIKERGRICIQLGFSDSGRFMGQIAANIAIERLQILLARALAAKGIHDIDVVIFNTHGESMGRGGFPGTLSERFDYLLTPWTRARYAHENLPTIAECSFQGGDGYLHFATPKLASATVRSLMKWSFEEPQADQNDQFYKDINYSWDFYRAVKDWQETLFDDPDYQVMIGAFGPNMLFTTGSRKVRRQSGAAITGPRSLRAIPHNAILQQLAAPANVFGGVGAAAALEAERLVSHVKNSSRGRQIMGVVQNARQLASVPALRAYGPCFSSTFWISKAAHEEDAAMSSACAEIAAYLSGGDVADAIYRSADQFAADLMQLDRVFLELYGEEFRETRRTQRRALHALHAIRQAYIMKGLILTAMTPSFSRRHDMSRRDLFKMAFDLRFDELADLLSKVFPAKDIRTDILSRIDEASDDVDEVTHGYPEVQTNVVVPLRDIHQKIREIGVGISHYYKAYG